MSTIPSLVDFVMENGQIKVLKEEIPTQSKYLSALEVTITRAGGTPTYIDVIKYMKILCYLKDNGPTSKRDLAKIDYLSKNFKREIKKYYQSPLTELTNLGLLEMSGVSKRYTKYSITNIGIKAVEDYFATKGAALMGTNFNREGLWLVPLTHDNEKEVNK